MNMFRNKSIRALAIVGALCTVATTGAFADHHASKSDEKHGKGASAEMSKPDIVETAVAAGSFETLVAAVKAAGLVETLKGEGPFTVFAPTDDAFAKLPKGTLESLLEPKNKDTLVSILTYHVVAGKVMAKDVVKLDKAETLNGQSVTIEKKEDGVYVDGAKVVKTDIQTSNGVIHVIDAVITPQSN
jgi:uncharacterized surface protein with fasciclin (FAS1) repeats